MGQICFIDACNRLEAEQEALLARMEDPECYQQGGDAIAEGKNRLESIETELL